ncbi:GGDEF domain-containing protein [Vibrio sp. 404]|uniref:diguanylate cyclase n=1 Tax=Vibrio marinisediminis TaxID=2758441 RepID=A0A7W2FTT3_9VIBR|nr:GGDEF domain-containing protein [Vibrio marinisediminis]MBA5764029.1 GGDEF domain-containing protein [Vibrio marinisediminis]
MSFSIVTSSWFRFSFPLGLLLLIAFGIDNVTALISANESISINLPYVLFTATIVLGHVFKQSRCAMVGTAMLVTYWIIQNSLQSPLSTGTTLLELSLLAFSLPAACLAIYPFKDNTIRSKGFASYLAILVLFVIWSQLTLNYVVDTGANQQDYALLYVAPEVSRLPLVLVLYLTAVVLSCAIAVLKFNQIIDAAVYSSVLIASSTFVFFHVSYISSALFSLSGILLLIYLMSASYELAFNDRLTGIPGRLALESDLKHLGRKYSLAMLDIDHFKAFNDTYGHDTGDDVLKLVASKLREVGGNARVYRYGGEEFTVLFKGKFADDAWDHLEELRISIEEYELALRNMGARPKDNKEGSKKRNNSKKSDTVSLTISIGVADSYEARDTAVVLKAADQALYKAKQTGRNRVVAAQ